MTPKCSKISYREITGTLKFHTAFAIDPIKLPGEAFGQRRIWREIGDFAKRSRKPIHLSDICELIDTKAPSLAGYHVQRSQEAGLVRKVDRQGGWVAID